MTNPAEPPSARPARTASRIAPLLSCVVLGAVWLGHSDAIDRLEITKLFLGAFTLTVAWFAVFLRADGRTHAGTSGPLALLGVTLASVTLVAPGALADRLEAWTPLACAVSLYALARPSEADGQSVGEGATLAAGISAIATLVALVGLGQAFGAEWFRAEVTHFAGRRTLGTLGNPAFFGVCLACALPWSLAHARHRAFAAASVVLIGAILLSGARTAWVMAACAVLVTPTGLSRRRVVKGAVATAACVLGLLLAAPGSDTANRIDDLTSEDGTAAGRLYLWRVHPRLFAEAGPIGGGPGAFARRWPAAQARYLADNPDDNGFYSDLRHAHADLVEIATDWGWLGLAAFLTWVVALVKRSAARPPANAEPDLRRRRAARATLLVAGVGGLATPVLFFTPSLLLVSIAAASLAPRASIRYSRGWRIGVALAVALTLVWVGIRSESERRRNLGLRAEIAGDLAVARRFYREAAEVDPANPLALAMVSRATLEVNPIEALEAARGAAARLPTASMFGLCEVAARAAGDLEAAAEYRATVMRLWRPSHP